MKNYNPSKIIRFLYWRSILLVFFVFIGFSHPGNASVPDLNYYPTPITLAPKHKPQAVLPPLFPRKSYFTDFGDEGSFNENLKGMANITTYSMSPSSRFGILFKNKVRVGISMEF